MRVRFLGAGVHCLGETGGGVGGGGGGDKEYAVAVTGGSVGARAPGLNPPYPPL